MLGSLIAGVGRHAAVSRFRITLTRKKGDVGRVTSKGQVTIPREIREKLGLLPETDVEFEIDGNAVRIRKARNVPGRRGAKLVEQLRGRASGGLSTDQIMKLTRGTPARRRKK